MIDIVIPTEIYARTPFLLRIPVTENDTALPLPFITTKTLIFEHSLSSNSIIIHV